MNRIDAEIVALSEALPILMRNADGRVTVGTEYGPLVVEIKREFDKSVLVWRWAE